MIPHDNKDIQAIMLGIALATFGGLAAFLQSHEGKGLTFKEFCQVLISKLIIAAFAGTVVGLLCQSLHLGVTESSVMASMAGFASKETLDWLKDRLRKKIES